MLERSLQNRTRITLLLAIVFTLNYAVTSTETRYGLGSRNEYYITSAVHQFERNLSFEFHDATNPLAVYGYSTFYFFVFPLLCVGVAFALFQRQDVMPYRVLALAVAIDYGVSLPFFLFFPVIERWAYPDSGAVLLSDQWSTKLIGSIRPISGLNDCFPSFHVSITVLVILICYLFKIRFRTVVLSLGLIIILSTFVLGIHWIADIIAGLFTGVISVLLALRLVGIPPLEPKSEPLSGP